MLIDPDFNSTLGYALYGSIIAFIMLIYSFFGNSSAKAIRPHLLIAIIGLPSCQFLVFGSSDSLDCLEIRAEVYRPEFEKVLPRSVKLNLYRDTRALYVGGPSHESLDFSDVNGNFQDDFWGDVGEFEKVQAAKWWGYLNECDSQINCSVRAYYIPNNFYNINLRIQAFDEKKGEFIDTDRKPIPTQADFLILATDQEYAYYECHDFQRF